MRATSASNASCVTGPAERNRSNSFNATAAACGFCDTSVVSCLKLIRLTRVHNHTYFTMISRVICADGWGQRSSQAKPIVMSSRWPILPSTGRPRACSYSRNCLARSIAAHAIDRTIIIVSHEADRAEFVQPIGRCIQHCLGKQIDCTDHRPPRKPPPRKPPPRKPPPRKPPPRKPPPPKPPYP